MADATNTSQALMKKIRQQKNIEASNHFTLGILSIVCLYTIYYWSGPMYRRFCLRSRSNTAFYRPLGITRKFRKLLILDVPGFQSTGHALIFSLYAVISLSVLFTNINWDSLVGFARRLGWLAILNMGLTIFLGLKHTPLSLLTDQSFEKLNCLHQIAGYSSIMAVFLHTVVYTLSLYKRNRLSQVLLEEAQIMGILAASAFLVILLSAVLIRKRFYEAFYVIHIVMVFAGLVLSGLHRPKLSKTKSTYILLFAGLIWMIDRLLRFTKYFINSFKNTATIMPLPCEGTRIVLRKPLKSTAPGQYYCIWLPGVRAFETHPFTCVSPDPGEFIISAHSGFTRSLYQLALKEPGAVLKASVDGPYGNPPDLIDFTKVLFIAGGSGASYTCSLAVDLVRRLGYSTKSSIDFTLVLKHKAMISWTSTYLNILASSPNVTLHLHVTRSKSDESPPNTFIPLQSDSPNSSSNLGDSEKVANTLFTVTEIPNSAESKENNTLATYNTYEKTPVPLNIGRPDLRSQISQAVNTSSTNERIAIVACGPDTMMVNIRRVVAENIHPEGPSVEVFIEKFGW